MALYKNALQNRWVVMNAASKDIITERNDGVRRVETVYMN